MQAHRLPDPHTLDLVIDDQLATLEFGDPEIVRRRMGHRFGEFIVEGTMLPLKFSNMRVDGHVEWLPVTFQRTPLTKSLCHEQGFMSIIGSCALRKIPAIHGKCL